METHSISVRLQRITKEYAYVRVPVTDAIMEVDEKGVGRIDPQKLLQGAVELGRLPQVEWYLEDRQFQPHPIQQAPGPGEKWF
jgi:hypothetical protein